MPMTEGQHDGGAGGGAVVSVSSRRAMFESIGQGRATTQSTSTAGEPAAAAAIAVPAKLSIAASSPEHKLEGTVTSLGADVGGELAGKAMLKPRVPVKSGSLARDRLPSIPGGGPQAAATSPTPLAAATFSASPSTSPVLVQKAATPAFVPVPPAIPGGRPASLNAAELAQPVAGRRPAPAPPQKRPTLSAEGTPNRSQASSPVANAPAAVSLEPSRSTSRNGAPSGGRSPPPPPLSRSAAFGAPVASNGGRPVFMQVETPNTPPITPPADGLGIFDEQATLMQGAGPPRGDHISVGLAATDGPQVSELHQQKQRSLSPAPMIQVIVPQPTKKPGPPAVLPPKPVIPPRPVFKIEAPTPTPDSGEPEMVPRPLAPPRPPSREGSTGSLVSGAPPPIPPSRPSSAPPPKIPLPPRRSTMPVKSSSVAVTPAPTPPPPAAAAAASTGGAYMPPPPPSRIIAAGDRLAPQRPAIASTSPEASGDSSPEEEEEDPIAVKSQSTPDATFANRKPPVLLGRRAVQAAGQFYSVVVRGDTVVTGQHHVYIWDLARGGQPSVLSIPGGEHKVHALEWRSAAENAPEDEGRYLWGGTKDGHVFEVDVLGCKISHVRHSIHPGSVTNIWRSGKAMVTLDDTGKMLIWGSKTGPDAANLMSTPVAQRIEAKPTFVALLHGLVWAAYGGTSSRNVNGPGGARQGPQFRVFDPTGPVFPLTAAKALTFPESAGFIGSVTTGTIVPSHPDLVYFGHENGYVSIWSSEDFAFRSIQRISPYMITALAGVTNTLWAGFRTGSIYVYDVEADPWVVRKTWKPHKETVARIVVDHSALLSSEPRLQVISAGADLTIRPWDGFLRQDWLDDQLQNRQPEYCSFRTIKALVVSWNLDACKPTDLMGPTNAPFLQEALTSVDSPDIIVFGFQEMINLEDKKLTAKSMLLGKKKADQRFADGISHSYRLWHDKLVSAVRQAMPADCPYTVVHVGDMIGLFSCIFVKTSETASLRDIALLTVKTGMNGRYGNKGAIVARFVIDDSSLCFVNVHLAAGQSHRRQRDADLINILEDKSSFAEAESSPGAYIRGSDGHAVFDNELVILSGDLNYRIDERREIVLDKVAKGDLESLLTHDQLLKNMATNVSFRLRSFQEPKITFAPTYKYTPHTDDYDQGPKRRIPAWCDRVLYRSHKGDRIAPLHYRRYEPNISDHRPISAAFEMKIKSIDHAKRSLLWEQIERAWPEVEKDLLEQARGFYLSYCL